MSTEIQLDRFQRWMQAVIVHPGSIKEAMVSSTATEEIPLAQAIALVLPSKTLSSSERIEIYQRMYLLRMLEVMEADYPALHHFLGDEAFIDLVRGYIQANPSRSYSLNFLGNYLTEYILSAPDIKKREFLYDLASLELAITQVFDEQESPILTAAAIAAVPLDAWERARLRPIKAFRILSFRYPVNDHLQSVRDGSPHSKVKRKDSWVVVYRRNYSVWRLELTHPAYSLLRALSGGTSLGLAIASVIQSSHTAGLEEQLFNWFQEWVSHGIFSSIEI